MAFDRSGDGVEQEPARIRTNLMTIRQAKAERS